MTETKHTPGPWAVDHPFGESGVYVQAPSTALICKLYPVDKQYVGDKLTSVEANARLIAAAPDGHEILAQLAEWINDGGGHISFDALAAYGEEERTVRQAILAYMKKVTGT